jgi:hypothetical protein
MELLLSGLAFFFRHLKSLRTLQLELKRVLMKMSSKTYGIAFDVRLIALEEFLADPELCKGLKFVVFCESLE